jgi:hypothetical protein
MKGIKEIKDEDLIEAFLLGDKHRGDKLVHGVLRKNGEVIVIFERLEAGGYSGFPEKSHLKLSSLNEVQTIYLREKGYSLSNEA